MPRLTRRVEIKLVLIRQQRMTSQDRHTRTLRLILSSIIIFWLFSTNLWMAEGQGSARSRAEITDLLRKEDNQGALTAAEGALKAAPRDCSLLSLRAISLTGLHRADAALQSFQKALTYCPAYLPALEGAAPIEYAQGSPGTVALLEHILAVQPQDGTSNAMLATLLRAQGKCDDALSHYRASAALFPNRPDLMQGYAACVAATGDLNQALALYQQLLISHPNQAIRYDIALLQWKTHAGDDALATLAALLVDAQFPPALALASKIHEERGETPEAVALLHDAIVKSPDDLGNYVDFATIAFTHRSFQVGIDLLDAGLKRLPKAAQLYVARGVLEVQISKNDAAIADFEQAHRLDPDLSFAVDAVGIMQSQQHQGAESLALFEAQVKQHEEDPLLQYLLAEQLSHEEDGTNGSQLSAAIAAAKRAATLDPKYQAAHDLLAVLYIRANQPVLAIQQAELALAINPNDQDALYQEIMASRRSGETSQIKALTDRLKEARIENGRKQQNADRYRLQEGSTD